MTILPNSSGRPWRSSLLGLLEGEVAIDERLGPLVVDGGDPVGVVEEAGEGDLAAVGHRGDRCIERGAARVDHELARYCLHALTAASELPAQAAVRRLVDVTLAGLRVPE